MIDWEAVRAEVTGYLQGLIRIDTTNPPGNETLAALYLEEILQKEGLQPTLVESEPGRGNVLARLAGGCEKTLMLLGHTDVVAVEPANGLKVPHMGWNDLFLTAPGHAVLDGLDSGTHTYFVHGYHLRCAKASEVIATVEYGEAFAAVVGRDNMIGTQFHPEKSQQAGLRLIANFLAWQP